MIGATIRIGREILCLPYAGFFDMFLHLLCNFFVCFLRIVFLKYLKSNVFTLQHLECL